MSDGTPFRDAEAWLAQRGIERDPIRVPLTPPDPPAEAAPAPPPPGPAADTPTGPQVGTHADQAPEPSRREAMRLAADAMDAAVRRADEPAATPHPQAHRMEDDVAEAVAFLRRSTSMTPQSEARLRAKLTDRDTPAPVIEQALERARRERLVDDAAMVAALVDERRSKGHAPARIRRDLRERGFGDDLLDAALASTEREDPEAAAYALATEKAQRCTALAPEAAYRRVAAFVVRRGYPEGLARKVAREAVFTARDAQRTAGH
ncbi:MAG TPA: regulatory protein RecX [Egicoccus sp.]|nr:regulatory protein RecX [Egicoccus sp.]HSK23106.1 regulatory protein RecX [Egicoccus sp.]